MSRNWPETILFRDEIIRVIFFNGWAKKRGMVWRLVFLLFFTGSCGCFDMGGCACLFSAFSISRYLLYLGGMSALSTVIFSFAVDSSVLSAAMT